MTISHPPTKFPFTYTWGIVGHSLFWRYCNWLRQILHYQYRENVRKLFDSAPQLRVSKHIISLHLVQGHSLQVQNLHHSPRETTLRFWRRPFHKQHDWFWSDSLLNGRARFLRQIPVSGQLTCDDCWTTGVVKKGELEFEVSYFVRKWTRLACTNRRAKCLSEHSLRLTGSERSVHCARRVTRWGVTRHGQIHVTN